VDLELFSASIPGTWEALYSLLDRYAGNRLQAVYEAGYFGFRLHDRLVEQGIACLVTPPSLVPKEYGNRVKTDRRDSRKLAHLLAKGLLKRVWVPSEEERYHAPATRQRPGADPEPHQGGVEISWDSFRRTTRQVDPALPGSSAAFKLRQPLDAGELQCR